jgi:hypothetical protein
MMVSSRTNLARIKRFGNWHKQITCHWNYKAGIQTWLDGVKDQHVETKTCADLQQGKKHLSHILGAAKSQLQRYNLYQGIYVLDMLTPNF